jgi:phage tail-like protein
MKTATPTLDRSSTRLSDVPPIIAPVAISGTLSEEAPGAILYVYLNMRRAGTTISASNAERSWSLPVTALSFGGAAPKLKVGDRLYIQARAVGKDMSDPTPIYTIGGIDQPGVPYVRDEAGTPRAIYERDSLLEGDVSLLLDFTDPAASVRIPYISTVLLGIAEGVSVSISIDESHLATVQSDRNGHWSLDLLSTEVVNHPLMPLKRGQILTATAFRYATDPNTGLQTSVLYPSAESLSATVLSGFFEQKLLSFYPAVWRSDDAARNGDLAAFTKVLALTMDEVKSYIDDFPKVFDIDQCDPKYFNGIATLLGYPLNRLDSVQSQRLQLKNAIQFWRKKGTADVFKILFYLLDYQINMLELWTTDYAIFYPGIMFNGLEVYPKSTHPQGPPNSAPELIENGGLWYKSPYFAIEINPLVTYIDTPKYDYKTDPVACPVETSGASISLSLDDLKYLLERIDYFRPAHTVLDYISFNMPILECGPVPDEQVEWGVKWQPQESPWGPYCDPDDPIYFRDGITSTRPDRRGTCVIGVTRDPYGPFASTKPYVNMKRNPDRGYCHPPEFLEFELDSTDSEYYYFQLRRDGLGDGMYPVQSPLGTIDMNEWPSRNPLCDPPLRDGKYRYVSRLVITRETYEGV